MFGDKASLIGKWGGKLNFSKQVRSSTNCCVGILFQGLIVGSLFFQLPDTTNGAFTRGGVLFFILLFNALLALGK